MQRITITIDDGLLETVDKLVTRRGYPSRSEAVRELVRDAASRERALGGAGPCLATLSYVYDHATRDLSERLIEQQHDHHDLTIAMTHVHVDHDTCLEVAILRGPIAKVRAFADSLTAQRGVRHASLHLIPADTDKASHRHMPGAQPHHHHKV